MKSLFGVLREAHSGPSGRLSSMRALTSLIVVGVMLVYILGAAVALLAFLRGAPLQIPDIPFGAAGLAAGAMGVKAWQRGREEHEPAPNTENPSEGRLL